MAQSSKSMKPGGGGRFSRLTRRLSARGAHDPRALAAWIGRRKWGKKRMARWAAKARKRGRR